MGKSPRFTKGPIVRTGPTAGKNRSRNSDGSWRRKRGDSGKSRKSRGGCFLTTAACEYKGLPDNCYELEVLRSFRDDYLLSMDSGRTLVAQYYQIAPNIVKHIKCESDMEIIWQVVSICVKAIESHQYQYAVEVYKNMVESMKKYNIE